MITWITPLCNLMSDESRCVVPAKTDESWCRVLKKRGKWTGEGNGKSLQHAYLENPMNSIQKPKDMPLKDGPWVGRCVGIAEDWISSSSRDGAAEPN